MMLLLLFSLLHLTSLVNVFSIDDLYNFPFSIEKPLILLIKTSTMDVLLKRYKALGQTFNPSETQIKKSLRVNTLKISEAKLVKRLEKKGVKLEKIKYLKNGYYYESEFSLGSTPEYLQGYYYLQEAASQLPVSVLNPVPGDIVLDMAAAPGSKTTQISQMMNNEGVVLALDIDKRRLLSLVSNLERLSAKNVVIYRLNARKADKLGIKFDKILLDAPCSGNFCVEKEFFSKRTVKDFEMKAETQKRLLETAVNCLKEGGTLVYSTCSLEPEEDELVIDWLLNKYPYLKLEEINIDVGLQGLTKIFNNSVNEEIKKTKKLWPHLSGTEGFFIAKIRK